MLNAAAVVRTDNAGNDHVLGYVEPGDVDVAAVEARVRELLPDYMVPTIILPMPALPTLVSGKVSRASLPDWQAASSAALASQSSSLRQPSTPTEVAVAAAWQDVLALGRDIGVDVDFVRVGGTSLQAGAVAARIGAMAGVRVPPALVLAESTIARLAAAVDALVAAGETGAPMAAATTPSERAAGVACSMNQAQMVVLAQLAPDSAAYNVSSVAHFAAPPDACALERALLWLATRHGSLRTTFAASGDDVVQVVAGVDGVADRVLQRVRVPGGRAALDAAAAADAAVPFQLIGGVPLFRALLLEGGAGTALAITLHHAVSDGWSQGLLWLELAAVYSALAAGGPPPALPTLTLAYADFAVWQRARLQTGSLRGQVDYWKATLAGAPPLLELPTDHPRPAVFSGAGACVPFALSPTTVIGLRSVAADSEATLFMALLAAFQTLLGRYARSDDVVIGTPAAGRDRPELEGLVGYFVNPVALRTDLSGAPSFRELLRRVRATVAGALANADVPFLTVVDAVGGPRGGGHSPIFQTMLALQDKAFLAPVQFGAEAVKPERTLVDAAMFDLTLDVSEMADGGLAGFLEYSSDLFDRATVERLGTHLRVLVEAAVADPDTPAVALPLAPPDEVHRVLTEFNDTASPYPADKCAHELFEAHVDADPGALCLLHDDGALTYGEVEAAANRLAGQLISLGVGPDKPVGLLMDRTPELVIAMLATLKAGGCYLPMDPEYPGERLAVMLEDSGAVAMVTHHDLAASLPGPPACPVVDLDDEVTVSILGARPPTRRPVRSTPTDLAYIIFTSGSTGRPKGTMLQHGGLVNMVHGDVAAGWGCSADARVTVFKCPISFDVAVLEVWGCLGHGRAMAIVKPGGHRDTHYLAATLARHGVEAADFVPSALQALMTEGLLKACPAFRTVTVGAEVVPPALPTAYHADLPHACLRNTYGPTEATVYVTSFTVPPGSSYHSLPIGKPTANTRVYVLDERQQPTPVGVPGELHISGVCLARGYAGRDDLTAEKFVANPYAGGDPAFARMYKSGDLVRWLPDGNLEFLGRVDHQVKLRGFRIELGEVEAAILAAGAGARSSAVLVQTDTGGQQRLVAYVTPAAVDVGALTDALRGRLPEYMVPALVMTLESMPTLPSGKVNRHALPAPDWAKVAAEEYVAPTTDLERAVQAVWQDVLGLDAISVKADFFRIGGTSLQAGMVATRIGKVVGTHVAPPLVLKHPTVASLAAAVDALAPGEATIPVSSTPTEREAGVICSFNQQQMVLLNQMAPDRHGGGRGRTGVGARARMRLPIACTLTPPLYLTHFCTSQRRLQHGRVPAPANGGGRRWRVGNRAALAD